MESTSENQKQLENPTFLTPNPKNDSDAETTYKLTLVNKVIKHNLRVIEKLCKTCIESKHIRIVRSKKITTTTRKLQEVYADLQGPHKPTCISAKNYKTILLHEFTRKS